MSSRTGNEQDARSESSSSYVYGPPSTTSRTTRGARVTASLDVAENPLCPRIRGLCCLLLLFNLAIALVCLGFVIVCQLPDPGFIWWIGLFILIFGFVTLVGSFIYCFIVCRQHKQEMEERGNDLRWNHHWSKTVNFGEINYDNNEGQQRAAYR